MQVSNFKFYILNLERITNCKLGTTDGIFKFDDLTWMETFLKVTEDSSHENLRLA